MPSAVSSLTDDLLKYYQQVTRAVLGDDAQLMKVGVGEGAGVVGPDPLSGGARPRFGARTLLEHSWVRPSCSDACGSLAPLWCFTPNVTVELWD